MDSEPLPDAPPDPISGVPHDAFKQVYLGQVSEPLVRPHPEPPEAEEDELTRAALADPTTPFDVKRSEPSAWRLVAILLMAALALAIVFGRR